MVLRVRHPSAETHPMWGAVLQSARHRLPGGQLDTLLADVCFAVFDPTTLRLGMPSKSVRRWVQNGALASLDSAVADALDGRADLAISPVADGDDALPLALDPTYTFARFTTSPSNQAAREAALAVAHRTGDAPNPAVFHGPEGVGKSHLLSCIAQELANCDGSEVHCVSGEELSLELIRAMRDQSLQSFQDRNRTCSALLVDDLSQLAGREATQVELLAALDALVSLRRPVVLTSPLPPGELGELSPALRKRLESATQIPLACPSWELKIAVVLDRIDRWGIAADQEVASFLVSRIGTDLRRLDALLTRLLLHPLCASGLPDVEAVRQVLGSGRTRPGPVPPETVTSLIARHFNLRVRDLRSATRSPRITTPRQIAMYLLRQHCSLSYPEIGQRFGRHHTTALHSVRQIARQLEENGSLRSTVRLLEKELLRSLETGE
jgi:chromosomal replication initiator protein